MAHWTVEDTYEVNDRSGIHRDGYRLKWLYPGPFVKFSGMDMGGKMTAVVGGFDNGPAILKVAGHNGWDGIGTTSYNPPQYLIGIIKGIDDQGNYGTFHQKYEIVYTRKHSKEAKAKAFELYETLKSETDYPSGRQSEMEKL